MEAGPSGARTSSLTALDGIGAVVALFATVALWGAVVVWRPAFAGMLGDFGGLDGGDALPLLSRFVLSPHVYALPVAPTVALGLALAPIGLSARRLAIVLSFVLASVGLGLVVTGAYLPVWQLSDSVGAD